MSNRKAQTATEYMIILAVVIIIALIVVGVLGGIPGIGTNARGRTSAAFWSTTDISIPSYSIDVNGNANFRIKNNFKDTITISNVSLSSGGSLFDRINMSESSIVLAPGQTKTFTNAAGYTALCGADSAGDTFITNVAITYTNEETGAEYTFTGGGTKLEGICAEG